MFLSILHTNTLLFLYVSLLFCYACSNLYIVIMMHVTYTYKLHTGNRLAPTIHLDIFIRATNDPQLTSFYLTLYVTKLQDIEKYIY